MQGVVCTLHEGDDFGKLALVNDAPRAASIVLRDDNCHFLRVDKEDFNRILRVSLMKQQQQQNTITPFWQERSIAAIDWTPALIALNIEYKDILKWLFTVAAAHLQQ